MHEPNIYKGNGKICHSNFHFGNPTTKSLFGTWLSPAKAAKIEYSWISIFAKYWWKCAVVWLHIFEHRFWPKSVKTRKHLWRCFRFLTNFRQKPELKTGYQTAHFFTENCRILFYLLHSKIHCFRENSGCQTGSKKENKSAHALVDVQAKHRRWTFRGDIFY